MSTQSTEAVRLDEQDERARRAERVARMFARRAAQDVSGEPEWDIEDIEPVRFRRMVVEHDDPRSEER